MLNDFLVNFGYVVLQKKSASFDTKITSIPICSVSKPSTARLFCNLRYRLVVQKLRRESDNQKLRRESVHARPFSGDFELKMLRMRGFSLQFLDNQPKNSCNCSVHYTVIAKYSGPSLIRIVLIRNLAKSKTS